DIVVLVTPRHGTRHVPAIVAVVRAVPRLELELLAPFERTRHQLAYFIRIVGMQQQPGEVRRGSVGRTAVVLVPVAVGVGDGAVRGAGPDDRGDRVGQEAQALLGAGALAHFLVQLLVAGGEFGVRDPERI